MFCTKRYMWVHRIQIQYHALAKTPAKEQTSVHAKGLTYITWIDVAGVQDKSHVRISLGNAPFLQLVPTAKISPALEMQRKWEDWTRELCFYPWLVHLLSKFDTNVSFSSSTTTSMWHYYAHILIVSLHVIFLDLTKSCESQKLKRFRNKTNATSIAPLMMAILLVTQAKYHRCLQLQIY